MVRIKGADEAVMARRLVAMGAQPAQMGLPGTALVGREWELNAVASMLRSVQLWSWVRRGAGGAHGAQGSRSSQAPRLLPLSVVVSKSDRCWVWRHEPPADVCETIAAK
jgi:hypothetical protein